MKEASQTGRPKNKSPNRKVGAQYFTKISYYTGASLVK